MVSQEALDLVAFAVQDKSIRALARAIDELNNRWRAACDERDAAEARFAKARARLIARCDGDVMAGKL